MSKMASVVLLAVCWFLLQASWIHAQNCPMIDSIFPPSGTVQVTFTVRGSNLQGVSAIAVNIGVDRTANINARNATRLQFVIGGALLNEGLSEVSFTASDAAQCQPQLDALPAIRLEVRQVIVLLSLVPTTGQSGSVIVFTGNFPPSHGDNSTVVGVQIGGIPADVLVIPTSSQSFMLVVRVGPSQTAISDANVIVMSNYSSFPVPAASFTYTAPGNITMVTPSQGQAGTRVVITGVNLNVSSHTLVQVLLAGNEAIIVSNNDTTIVCMVMSGSSGSGSVILNYTRDVDGVIYNGPTVVRNNSWVQLADGVINRIVPSTAAVNQTVFACGDNLLGGGNQIVSVAIGSVNALQFSSTNFTLANLTCINITLPFGLTGSLPITLTADTGAVIRSIVNVSIASITSVSRESGQYGTRVNISGVELFRTLSSTTVMLAGVDASIESNDTTSRTWIVVRAGRPPLLSRINITENCTTLENCTSMINVTSNCSDVNCSVSSSINATFLTESCLTNCFGQNVSMCFTACSVNGILNQTCFLQCDNSTAITDNSTRCFTACTMPCCVNVTTVTCENVTTCVNVSTTEMFEGSFSGQVAIVTEELGLTFNLTNSSVLWTYNISGRIETVTPSFGQLGTRVALNGTNLFGYGTSLQQILINGTMATIVSNTSTAVVFTAPNISNGSSNIVVDIELTSDSGAIVESIGGFQYLPAGMIITLVPAAGQLGTYVNISGRNLLGYGNNVTSVMFGGQPVNVINASNTTIFIRINASRNNNNEESVNVTIVSDTFAIVSSDPAAWSFVVEGRVTSVTPSEGQSGTFVTLTGTNLLGNGDNITSVYLDGIPANVVGSPSNTEVRVRISTNNQQRIGSQPGEVRIMANTGAIVTAAPNVMFTVRESGVITGFSPRIGREGTYITITGINLHAFGGEITNAMVAGISVMANSIQFDSSNPSIVTVRAGPSSSAISGNVQLFIDSGPIVLSNTTYNFTYVAPANITMVTPSSGVEGVGVLITGDDLYITNTSLVDVFLAGTLVTRVVVDTQNIIAVIAGQPMSSTPSSTEVLITASDGSVARGSTFTYNTPHLLRITPILGQFNMRVTILFPTTFNVSDGNLSVLVDNVLAVITSSNSSAANISIPRAQRQGSLNFTVDIVVENSNGEVARLTNGFTYLTEGVILDVTPNSGQRGTVVTVTGYQLLGWGRSLQMATLAGVMTRIMNGSNSTVVVLEVLNNINSATSQVGDVVLTADSGAVVRQQRGWTAVVPSVISAIQPTSGQLGTIVNITGIDLLQGGLEVRAISLAGIEVYDILNASSSYILVRASNASANLAGLVRVELETGAYYQSNVNWVYSVPTTISRVFPIIGAVGSTITIQLANFNTENITMVTIDDIPATILTRSGDSVSVTVPTGNYSSEAVAIVIETASGLIVRQNNAFTIEELGNITGASPTIIQQGIEVTITGENLLGISNQTAVETVWLAGVPANEIIFYNDSVVIVEAGYNATNVTGNITIQLNTSANIISDLDSTIVSYYEAEIFSVTPSIGYIGTRFNISGINLIQPNSSLDSVMIGNINATVEEYSSEYIIARAGVPCEEDVNVSMTVSVLSESGAFIELPDSWTYPAIPRITSVMPNMTAAGNNVTIFGTDLPVNNLSMILIGGISVDVFNFSETMIDVQLSFSVGDFDPQRVEILNIDGTEVISDPIFSYDETVDNSIISVIPSAGVNGTLVTIVVNNTLSFDNITIHLANVMTTNVTVINSTTADITVTTITVTAGYGDDVTGDVFISTDDGMLQFGLQDGWRYLPVLNSTQVAPQRGQQGTNVTVTVGPMLLTEFNITRVTLAGVNATILNTSDNSIVMVQAGQMVSATNLSDVVLHFEDNVTLPIPQSWSYLPPINVTMVSNNATGYYGTMVTIYGVNFLNGQPSGSVNITEVLLAGNISTTILSYNDTIITCNISQFVDSSQGPIFGPIIVRNSLGFFDNTSSFTYVQVNVTNVSPSRGQNGTMVTIEGVGLLANATNVTALWLNSVPVRSILTANNSVIVVQADHSNVATPLGNITYRTNTGATVTAPQAWYYVAPAVVSSISPVNGSEGTVVTIRGIELLAGGDSEVSSIDAIYLDGVAVSTVLTAFPGVLQVTAGYRDSSITDSMPGAVSVRLSTGATWMSPNVTFTHLPPGTITMVNPMRGQNGTVINITGTSLYPPGDSVMSVTLAGVTARVITATNRFIQVTAARPATLESFSGPVIIQAVSGALLRYDNNFTYLQEGIIFAVTPRQGQNGAQVKIEGQDLFGGGSMPSMVWLAGVAADIDNSSNSSCVIVTALDNPSSNNDTITGDIVLISNTGAHVRRINGWRYIQRGVITSITPASGQYGTTIIINGMRLLSGSTGISQITIGGVAVDNVSGDDTVITGQAGNRGNNSAINGMVSIISSDGGILASNFTWSYNQGGVISNFTPTSGGNNQIINITGTNLLGSGMQIVEAIVAGVLSMPINAQNNTSITIQAGIVEVQLQEPREGPIVLIANTRARIESTANYSFSSPCNISQYVNDTTGGVIVCTDCDSVCASCNGPTDSDCLMCSPTAFLVRSTGNGTLQCTAQCQFATEDRRCVGLCEADQYESSGVAENTTFCLDCSEMCAPNTSCNGPAPTQCHQCRNVLYMAECIESCPPNTYGDQNGTCLQCHEQCNNCTGPTASECINCQNLLLTENISTTCVAQCPPNYYRSGVTCLPCDPQCEGCTGRGPLQCTECRSVGIRRSDDGMIECLSSCNNISINNISYLNMSTNICERCSDLCSTDDGCTGPTASDCRTCRNGTYYSAVNDTCILDCSQLSRINNTVSYYNNDATRNCEICDVSCGDRGCSGAGPSDCLSADTNTNTQTEAFDAGVGTIIIVIIVCVVLFLMLLLCTLIFCIQRSRNSGKYSAYPQVSGERNTEMSQYTVFKEKQETNFSNSGTIGQSGGATNKPPIDVPTADEMYTDMSGTDDTLKRPLTGPKPVNQGAELYIDVPNSPQAANQDVGGEEYIDVQTPGAQVITNLGYDEGEALYEDTDQAAESAKAYVRLQKKEPPAAPSLPPSRSRPSIPRPSNPLEESLLRATPQVQPQPDAIYEEGPIEEQLYDAVGTGEPPPSFKPPVPPAASVSATNPLPLPPK